MPRGHGRVGVSVEKVSERRSSALSKRYSDKKSCMLLANAENQVLIPVVRNCEQRYIVLSFLTLDVHSWKLLVPFSSFNHQSLLRSESGSENPVNVDSLDSSLPHPTIFIQFDLQKEQSISVSQNSVFSSVKAVTDCKSSNIVAQPARRKRNKTVKNSPSNSIASSAAPKDSSGLIDCFDIIASETFNQADKPLKRGSRKKGKKKRKQSKKYMQKKSSIEGETLGDDVNHDASFSEVSTVGDLTYSVAHTSENELSPNVACPKLEVKGSDDVVMEKLSMDCNTKEYLSTSSRSLGEPLDENRKDDFRKIDSPSHDLTDEGIDKIFVNNFATSFSTQLSKSSSCISLQNNPERDMAADSTDIYETRSSIANNGDFKTSPNMAILTSGSVSAEGEYKEPHHKDNEASSSCSINHSYWQRDVGDSDCCTERALCSSQASSSDDFHPVIRTKRGRLARKFAGSSLNGMHRPRNAHLHGHTYKDTKHSIWERIEKNGKVDLVSPKNNRNLATIPSTTVETHIRHKKISGLNQNRDGINCRYSSSERDSHASHSDTSNASPEFDDNSGHLSYGVINGRSTYTQPENMKRKSNSSIERESYKSVIASQISKENIPRPPNVELQEKGSEAISEFNSISLLTDRSEWLSRTHLNLESNNMQQDPAPENICSISHNRSSRFPENQTSFADAQFHNNTNSSKDESDDSLLGTSNEDEQCTNLKAESAYAKSSGTDSIDGAALQKWVPTGRNDLITNGCSMDDRADSVRNDLVFNDFKLSSTEECFSFSTVELQCSSPSSGYMDCSSLEEDDLTSKHEAEVQDCPGFESDLNNIMDAVDKSCKFLFASEGFHLATGSPLAEFERILRSATPVLCDMDCISTCTTCFCGQINGYSVCSHLIPSISLERFWQWYEKPGSYGLEVKIDEFHTSKRSRNLPYEVRAFFVPYLSAIQLFSRVGKTACGTNNDAKGDFLKTFDVYRTSKSSSSFGSLPIFSKLLPQPRKVTDTRSKELSLSGKCEDLIKTISSEEISCEDLLFEYFDSDQPQQRRPLFDKINQLVSGDLSSNCHFSGDPSKLNSLNLKDIHPASWYAVAWYPIYRIPDDSFRAAFLTYHSFGRFIPRNGGRTNSVVSPVVGLQSYNPKGECWFEPTKLNTKAFLSDEALTSYASETLFSRIQSLEQAAHVMSRATVRKGGLKSVNVHPDYEFFLSRRR